MAAFLAVPTDDADLSAVQRVFDAMDANGDRAVSWREFCHYFRNQPRAASPAKLNRRITAETDRGRPARASSPPGGHWDWAGTDHITSAMMGPADPRGPVTESTAHAADAAEQRAAHDRHRRTTFAGGRAHAQRGMEGAQLDGRMVRHRGASCAAKTDHLEHAAGVAGGGRRAQRRHERPTLNAEAARKAGVAGFVRGAGEYHGPEAAAPHSAKKMFGSDRGRGGRGRDPILGGDGGETAESRAARGRAPTVMGGARMTQRHACGKAPWAQAHYSPVKEPAQADGATAENGGGQEHAHGKARASIAAGGAGLSSSAGDAGTQWWGNQGQGGQASGKKIISAQAHTVSSIMFADSFSSPSEFSQIHTRRLGSIVG